MREISINVLYAFLNDIALLMARDRSCHSFQRRKLASVFICLNGELMQSVHQISLALNLWTPVTIAMNQRCHPRKVALTTPKFMDSYALVIARALPFQLLAVLLKLMKQMSFN